MMVAFGECYEAARYHYIAPQMMHHSIVVYLNIPNAYHRQHFSTVHKIAVECRKKL